MATLILSTQMKKMWRDGFANYSSGGDPITGSEYNQPYNQGFYIYIYDGTINDIGASTQLWRGTVNNVSVETDGDDEIINYGTNKPAATASGTANWFRLANSNGTMFYGTVGISGSFDLMIGNTAIISGQEYIINNLKFKFSNAV